MTESKYERIRRVGIGSYGIVFKCVDRQTGQIVAIKRYSESDSDPIIRKIASREIRFLRALKHPNLIDLLEVFRRKRRLHLVFDYCELTLLDVIEKYTNSCPLSLIKKIIWQTVNAVAYCHARNCIHRDIKPENILISKTGVVKLCDFGFARSLSRSAPALTALAAPKLQPRQVGDKYADEAPHTVTKLEQSSRVAAASAAAAAPAAPAAASNTRDRVALTEYVATRWYRAPELLIGDAYYDFKIDVWALGCVASELIRGEPMWPAKTDVEQLVMIKNSLGSLTARQCAMLASQRLYDTPSTQRLVAPQVYLPDPLERKLPARVGRVGFDFVASCLHMDEARRVTANQLLRHPFIHSSRVAELSAAANVGDGGARRVTPPIVVSKAARVPSPLTASSVKRAERSSGGGGGDDESLQEHASTAETRRQTPKKRAKRNKLHTSAAADDTNKPRKQTVIPTITTKQTPATPTASRPLRPHNAQQQQQQQALQMPPLYSATDGLSLRTTQSRTRKQSIENVSSASQLQRRTSRQPPPPPHAQQLLSTGGSSSRLPTLTSSSASDY